MTANPLHAVLHFTLATAGHVDHGKTSLLRALTGIDPDRLKEEKEREMTTDIGFAHLRHDLAYLKTRSEKFVDLYSKFVSSDRVRHDQNDNVHQNSELVIGFVDVPGHGKFLKNMLAGVGGIDMALLVVALDEGVMPQTVQHVKILSLLGIKKCILVLTKVDLAHESEVESARQKSEELLKQYDIEAVSINTVSNMTGFGMEELKDSIIENVLSSTFFDNRFDLNGKEMPCFLPVDRTFVKAGYGVVVTGTLISGQLKVGDNIKIAPANIEGRVRGLETFNRRIDKAYPGQRLAVNIATKDAKALERGQCVVSDSVKRLHVRTLIVKINDLGGLEVANDRKYKKLRPQTIRFYHGTAERAGSLRWLTEIQKADGTGGTGQFIGQVYLREPIIAYPGQNYVLRYGDYGIAGGVIAMTDRPRWLSRDLAMTIASQVLTGNTSAAILEYILNAPGHALSREDILSIVGLREAGYEIDQLKDSKQLTQLNHLLIANKSLEVLSEQIKDFLKTASGQESSSEAVRVKVAPLMERVVFQHLINHLLSLGKIQKSQDKICLPASAEKQSSTSGNERESQVLEILSDCLLLELSELSQTCKISATELESLMKSLERDGKAYIVNYDFAGSSQSLTKAHQVLSEIWSQKRSISPSDFRQAMGTSRKYAMAMLAHFDDMKVTRRLPSGRVLLKGPDSKN